MPLPAGAQSSEYPHHLHHPNILTIYDVGREGGVSYLAMEWVEGHAVGLSSEKLRKHLDGDVALELRVARAVDLAHPTLRRLAR